MEELNQKRKINRVVSEGQQPIRAKRFPKDLEDVQINFGNLQPLPENQRTKPHLSPLRLGVNKTRPSKNFASIETPNSPFVFDLKKLPQAPEAPDYVINFLHNFKKVKMIQKDQAFVDYTIFKLQNGLYYQGSLRFGRLQGEGGLYLKMVNPDMSGENPHNFELYKGSFMQDQVEGKGMLRFENDIRYEGNFVGGRAHGSGTLFKGSEILISGIWINGLYNY